MLLPRPAMSAASIASMSEPGADIDPTTGAVCTEGQSAKAGMVRRVTELGRVSSSRDAPAGSIFFKSIS